MTDKPASIQAGRLALREEGENWNAYFAMPGTMQGAIFLGSIRMALIRERPRCRAQFMALMREAVTDILQEATGTRPLFWNEQPAPEDERSGNA
jgi:hypothetical protein